MDISYQTYWKHYLKDREPGPDSPWPVGVAWLELARFIQQYVLSRRVSSILEVTTVNPTLQARLLELSERLPDEDLVLAISFLEGRAEHYRENPWARP